jgi:hypothetical protein
MVMKRYRFVRHEQQTLYGRWFSLHRQVHEDTRQIEQTREPGRYQNNMNGLDPEISHRLDPHLAMTQHDELY